MFDILHNVFYSIFQFFGELIGGRNALAKPEYFWAFFAGFWTVILVAVAYFQLKRTNKISSAEFIHKLKNDFFCDKNRVLMFLVDNDCLRYEDKDGLDNSYFTYNFDDLEEKLKEDFEKNLSIIFGYKKEVFSCMEIDDLLLGHFEDLGIFEQQGIISINMAYEEFDYYLETAWGNCAIRKYIKLQRGDGDDIYDKFEYIYEKCKSFGKAKEKRSIILLWKLRWFLKPPIS